MGQSLGLIMGLGPRRGLKLGLSLGLIMGPGLRRGLIVGLGLWWGRKLWLRFSMGQNLGLGLDRAGARNGAGANYVAKTVAETSSSRIRIVVWKG